MSQISTESVSTNAILYQEKMLAVARLASGLSSDVGELVDAAAASIREALVTAGGVSDDRSLENAAASLQRASMILRQIELFARAAPVKPTLRSLARVINDLLPLAHRLAGESVRVLSGPFEESVWVMADAGNLEQVLFHLVVNARDAMPTGGSVRLSIRRVQTVEPLSHRHGVLDAGDWAVLEVIDSGTGMPEAVYAAGKTVDQCTRIVRAFLDRIHRVFDAIDMAQAAGVQATLKHLVGYSGSVAGRKVPPGSLYGATKWAVTAMAEAAVWKLTLLRLRRFMSSDCTCAAF